MDKGEEGCPGPTRGEGKEEEGLKGRKKTEVAL